MSKFLKGFGAGLVTAGIAVGGLAWAQQPVFPAPNAGTVGLSNNFLFGVVCTTSNGVYDSNRRMTVLRPRGDQNSPDVTLRCEPR
jgi:hypothetical protein